MANREDIALMAHLMRRAGFGASRAELEARVARGYEATVEELAEAEKHGIPENDVDLLFRHMPGTVLPGGVPFQGQGNYMWQMINTQRPLQEKVALFWHQLFATGNSKVDNCDQVLTQIDMFRRHGMGSYRDLLLELAKNPAMIFWLDNNANHKDQPNENWGRELLELFSMGVGNYTEQDVFECSRAFTGWTIAAKIPRLPLGRFPWEFEYKPEDHDEGEKVFLGHRGNFNGDDIINIIVRQPATARFIARHLYNFFVADEAQVPAWQHTPPRDPAALNIIGDAFVSSGYQMRDTLRVLFNSDFFKSAHFAKVKSPAEVVVGTMNLVGDFKGYPKPGLMELGMEPTNMGQSLLDPPSVEGWHTGAEWIDSGSLVRRINFVADRVGDIRLPGVQDLVHRVRAQGTIAPEQLVECCLDLMGPTQVGEVTHQELVLQAQAGGKVRWDGEESKTRSTRRVLEMLQLIASSREYQFG
jgi:hypothetical protein